MLKIDFGMSKKKFLDIPTYNFSAEGTKTFIQCSWGCLKRNF
jgi:hypothetical protein